MNSFPGWNEVGSGNLREGRRPEEIAVIEAALASAKAQAAEAAQCRTAA